MAGRHPESTLQLVTVLGSSLLNDGEKEIINVTIDCNFWLVFGLPTLGSSIVDVGQFCNAVRHCDVLLNNLLEVKGHLILKTNG